MERQTQLESSQMAREETGVSRDVAVSGSTLAADSSVDATHSHTSVFSQFVAYYSQQLLK